MIPDRKMNTPLDLRTLDFVLEMYMFNEVVQIHRVELSHEHLMNDKRLIDPVALFTSLLHGHK